MKHLKGIALAAFAGCISIALLPSIRADTWEKKPILTVSEPIQMSVSLDSTLPSPQPVGTMVTWVPTVSEAGSGSLWYRFRIRRADEDFRTVRDYGPVVNFDWTASQHEGMYEIEVSVRNRETREAAQASMLYEMTSRITGDMPVISKTAHPLVWMCSAPGCPAGGRMNVQFRSPSGYIHTTTAKACLQYVSMNFYLAGMHPDGIYTVKHVVENGSELLEGPELDLKTGTTDPERAWAFSSDELLLHSTLNSTPNATDLQGNVVWFYPAYVSILTRPVRGGFFVGIVDDEPEPTAQIVREFDLVGMTVRETNAAVVSEQLVAQGKRPITGFHHEARPLPDGKLLVLAAVEQLLTDVQGPGPVDVIGDMIVVLDRDLEVVWAWDAFDHLDTSRVAILAEKCRGVSAGCPAFHLAPEANDWLHSNSVQLTPDGNLLLSIRHQDWVIKIDYSNGVGSGNVIWRLGKDGDFWLDSTDPNPWFSHQHDAEFEFGDNQTIILFDNGNTRRGFDSNAHSRGQIIQLDEQNRIAHLRLNADLEAYSAALGSAQKLPNGNYEFDLGFLPDRTASVAEVDSSGKVVSTYRSKEVKYRVFRMPNLYEP